MYVCILLEDLDHGPEVILSEIIKIESLHVPRGLIQPRRIIMYAMLANVKVVAWKPTSHVLYTRRVILMYCILLEVVWIREWG